MSHLDAAARARATALMAELNEAYAVLANPHERREYDQKLRAYQAGEVVEEPPPPAEAAPEAPPVVVPRVRPRAGAEVLSELVRQFAAHLRENLLSKRQTFPWRERKLEGFDWALEAGFLTAHYYVASRGFTAVDLAAAQKFTNYAHLALEEGQHWFKSDFFLFLLPFQRMSDSEQVSSLCRRFRPPRAGMKSLIVLADVTHGRGLPCGPRIRDERFEELLQQVGLAQS